LIRQGAKLVETVSDVLEELHLDATPALPGLGTSNPEAASGDDAEEPELLRHLGFDPVSLDALCARTGFSAAALQARLLELELTGSVGRLPGGLFQRIASA
jgi:DNA processing protein